MRAGVTWISLLSSAFLVTFAGADRAEACSCMAPRTPAEEMDTSAAVFEGRVLGVADGTVLQRAVRFEVLRAWKGAQPGETVTVETNQDSAACGVTVSNEMLVYARAHVEQGIWVMSLCSRTRPIAHAQEDIDALGPPLEPVPTGNGGGGAGGEVPAPTPGMTGSGGVSGTQPSATPPPGPGDGCMVGGRQPGAVATWTAALSLLWLLRRRARPALLKSRRR